MSFVIAAAGTGGHVFPGLAVAEALLTEGIDRSKILFVGGDRLESQVYPANGFDFLGLDLRGLKRSLSPSNLSLPAMVMRARNRIAADIEARRVGCLLGMGGYVTIPAAMAATKTGTPLMISEQNAGAGLASRIAARWATRAFVSFPQTKGLEDGEWVGNPVRSSLADFDREALRHQASDRYGLTPGLPVLGVFGGSLGAAAINEAVGHMVAAWTGPEFQILHLVGRVHESAFQAGPVEENVHWIRLGFEDQMEYFFAAADLVIARAGGAVAEITATGTPSILVPGKFGSTGHQAANAAFLGEAGAATVVDQDDIGALTEIVARHLWDESRLEKMAQAAHGIARPDAAKVIARAMIEGAA